MCFELYTFIIPGFEAVAEFSDNTFSDCTYANYASQRYYYGNTEKNGWGFYNQSSGALYAGSDNTVTTLSTTLKAMAESSDETIQGRFNSMQSESIAHNINDPNLPSVTRDAAGNVVSTNTTFSPTATQLDPLRSSLPGNGVNNATAQFASDFLSGTFLASRGVNTMEGSGFAPIGGFDNGRPVIQPERTDTPLSGGGQPQGAKSYMDREYIQAKMLQQMGLQSSKFYASPLLTPNGKDYIRDASMNPVWGIFSTNWRTGQDTHYNLRGFVA